MPKAKNVKSYHDEGMLSERQFADLCGLSLNKSREFRRIGAIPFYRFPTASGIVTAAAVRYHRDDVDAFLAKHKYLGKEPVNGNGNSNGSG